VAARLAGDSRDMLRSVTVTAPANDLGELLQYWRKARQLSQLALANEAEVSPRHICFLETGRARPSREMVLLLASVLEVPLRERNALLLSAGFAPVYSEAGLDAPALSSVRAALDAILRQQEPFPAIVMSRSWDILQANQAALRFFGMLLGRKATGSGNVLRLMFDPKGLRPYVANWDAVAGALIQRVQREAVGGVKDQATVKLLDEVLGYPGVPSRLRQRDHVTPLSPIIPIQFHKRGKTYGYFSTVTTLGTPQDITVQELRIECFFPVDDDTRRHARADALTGD
jgi:transcriptional regulator with XRE-family HTH domain